MNSDLKEKQQYLRSEIIDKGYDPIDFTEFLEEQRDDGNKKNPLKNFPLKKNSLNKFQKAQT
jgi:hypothetical protein